MACDDSLNNVHPYKEIAPVFDNSPYLKLVPGVQGFDVPSRDGLLGEWLFEDNVNDTSGNNYHGTHVGTASYVTDTPTGSGKAINLNGNKYVKVDDGQNQTVFNGDKKFTISTWVKEQPMAVGSHGYPSVEKVVVVGNYAAKVAVWLRLPPMAQVVAMEICAKARFGTIPSGTIWQPCTVPGMALCSGFMWMENYFTSSKEWAVLLGIAICSFLELAIIIIHLAGTQIPIWMMCVSTTVH